MKPLNENQKTAVTHGDGPMMVLAGPGSGKTTVIIHRINHLISELQINPKNVLVITFTKAATEEMQKRFIALAGQSGAGVTFSTFHALFYRIIRSCTNLSSNALLTDIERREAIKGIMKEMHIEADDEEIQSVCNEISRLKNELIDVESHNPVSMGADEFIRIVKSYESLKEDNGRIDFDDMLVKCHEILSSDQHVLHIWQNKFPYILVDEFQDICYAQYRCICMIAGTNANLFIVGDDDQSIYRFRGARPEFLLRFPKDFPNAAKTVLDTNYRSTEQVIRLCNSVISRNTTRYSKVIMGTNRKGPEPAMLKTLDTNAEAREIGRRVKRRLSQGIPPDEIAVIYRVNMQSRALTDAFMNFNIPYKVKDEAPSIYEHWISKDIYAYLRLSYDRDVDNCCLRIINKPKRYISNVALEMAKRAGKGILSNLNDQKQLKIWQLTRIEELTRNLNDITKRKPVEAIKYIRHIVGYNNYLDEYRQYRKIGLSGLIEVLDELQEAAGQFQKNEEFTAHMENVVAASRNRDKESSNETPGVLLSTMHSAKGLEFDTVFIAGAVEGNNPHERSKTNPELEEERRLFYVGLTRAKKHLYISIIKKRHEAIVKPTRFLEGLLKK